MKKVIPLRKIYKIENRILKKKVKRSLHQLQRPPAWCVQREILEDAKKRGIERVQIFEKEEGTCYVAAVDLIFQKGFTINRGFGEQIALPLKYWTVITSGMPIQLSFSEG